jgi:hypothetical protein
MGFDLWYTSHPLKTVKVGNLNLYIYDKEFATVDTGYKVDDIRVDELEDWTYNHSYFSNVCWDHIDFTLECLKDIPECPDCKKEKLWYIRTDYDRRLGKDIAERADRTLEILRKHGITEHRPQSMSFLTLKDHMSYFYSDLLNLSKFAKLNPFTLFGIHNYEPDEIRDYFFDENDNQIFIMKLVKEIVKEDVISDEGNEFTITKTKVYRYEKTGFLIKKFPILWTAVVKNK